MLNQFSRTELLLGKEAMEKLGHSRVAVFGVDTVFSMLDDAKIYTVDDFYNSKWKKVQELMKAKSKLSPETQELFSQALRMLWKTGNQTVKKSVKQAVLEKVEEANSLFSNDKSKKSMKSSKK